MSAPKLKQNAFNKQKALKQRAFKQRAETVDHHERGAVLLTTLLIMVIMATLAVAMMDDVRYAVKRSANTQAYAQADWYVQGAEDFAKAHIEGLVIGNDLSLLNVGLKDGQQIAFPIEGGLISLMVRDGSQCLSLGSLVSSESRAETPGRRQFRQLLIVLGWDAVGASRLTSAAADWIDTDSQPLPDGAEDYSYLGANPAYRAANTEFSSVMELRALSGMDEDKFLALRPFICARPSSESSGLNINTLSLEQSPLLAALLGGEDFTTIAQELIKNRPQAGYTKETFDASPHLEDVELASANIDDGLIFEPEHIWIEADITLFGVSRTSLLEYSIKDGDVRRIFRRTGPEARRPVLRKTET